MKDIGEKICRLCFSNAPDDFEFVDSNTTDKIGIVLPDLNLSIFGNSILCNKCSLNLSQAFAFKSSCLEIEDNIHNYTNNGQMQVNLEKILGLTDMDDNLDDENMIRNMRICRTCLDTVEVGIFTRLDGYENHLMNHILQKCLPELDHNLTKDPGICDKCKHLASRTTDFISQCMDLEAKIMEYLKLESSENLSINNAFKYVFNEKEGVLLLNSDVTIITQENEEIVSIEDDSTENLIDCYATKMNENQEYNNEMNTEMTGVDKTNTLDTNLDMRQESDQSLHNCQPGDDENTRKQKSNSTDNISTSEATKQVENTPQQIDCRSQIIISDDEDTPILPRRHNPKRSSRITTRIIDSDDDVSNDPDFRPEIHHNSESDDPDYDTQDQTQTFNSTQKSKRKILPKNRSKSDKRRKNVHSTENIISNNKSYILIQNGNYSDSGQPLYNLVLAPETTRLPNNHVSIASDPGRVHPYANGVPTGVPLVAQQTLPMTGYQQITPIVSMPQYSGVQPGNFVPDMPSSILSFPGTNSGTVGPFTSNMTISQTSVTAFQQTSFLSYNQGPGSFITGPSNLQAYAPNVQAYASNVQAYAANVQAYAPNMLTITENACPTTLTTGPMTPVQESSSITEVMQATIINNNNNNNALLAQQTSSFRGNNRSTSIANNGVGTLTRGLPIRKTPVHPTSRHALDQTSLNVVAQSRLVAGKKQTPSFSKTSSSNIFRNAPFGIATTSNTSVKSRTSTSTTRLSQTPSINKIYPAISVDVVNPVTSITKVKPAKTNTEVNTTTSITKINPATSFTVVNPVTSISKVDPAKTITEVDTTIPITKINQAKPITGGNSTTFITKVNPVTPITEVDLSTPITEVNLVTSNNRVNSVTTIIERNQAKSMTEINPATSITGFDLVTSMTEVNPATSITEVESATPITEINPATPVTEINLVTPITEVDPVTSITGVGSATSITEVDEATPNTEVVPTTRVTEVELATPITEINQATPITEINPATPITEINPVSPITEVDPVTTMIGVNPATSITDVESATSITGINPATSITKVDQETTITEVIPATPITGDQSVTKIVSETSAQYTSIGEKSVEQRSSVNENIQATSTQPTCSISPVTDTLPIIGNESLEVANTVTPHQNALVTEVNQLSSITGNESQDLRTSEQHLPINAGTNSNSVTGDSTVSSTFSGAATQSIPNEGIHNTTIGTNSSSTLFMYLTDSNTGKVVTVPYLQQANNFIKNSEQSLKNMAPVNSPAKGKNRFVRAITTFNLPSVYTSDSAKSGPVKSRKEKYNAHRASLSKANAVRNNSNRGNRSKLSTIFECINCGFKEKNKQLYSEHKKKCRQTALTKNQPPGMVTIDLDADMPLSGEKSDDPPKNAQDAGSEAVADGSKDKRDARDRNRPAPIGKLQPEQKGLAVLKCDLCSFNARTYSRIEKHIREHISELGKKNIYQCDVCEDCFTTIGDISNHLKYTHNLDYYKLYYWCVKCASIFKRPFELNEHYSQCLFKDKVVRLFKSNDIIFCLLCEFETEDVVAARSHLKSCRVTNVVVSDEVIEID